MNTIGSRSLLPFHELASHCNSLMGADPPQPTPCCVFGAFKLDPSEIEKLDPLERKAEKQEAKKMCARNLTFVQRKDEGITAKLLLEEFTRDVEPHVWLWCVPGMMFFVVWISMLQYLQHALAEAGNRQNINVSQYAVMISNVGGVIADDERLKDFGRYYGDVVAAFHVRDYGRYLIKNLEVRIVLHFPRNCGALAHALV